MNFGYLVTNDNNKIVMRGAVIIDSVEGKGEIECNGITILFNTHKPNYRNRAGSLLRYICNAWDFSGFTVLNAYEDSEAKTMTFDFANTEDEDASYTYTDKHEFYNEFEELFKTWFSTESESNENTIMADTAEMDPFLVLSLDTSLVGVYEEEEVDEDEEEEEAESDEDEEAEADETKGADPRLTDMKNILGYFFDKDTVDEVLSKVGETMKDMPQGVAIGVQIDNIPE